MRKQPSSINRILNKCKDYLISVLIFILFLCFLLLFKCKSRYGYRKERQEKREAAITTSMIKAIESDKNPVYTIHGKNKTLELPMEVTDKGKLVSVVWNGHKTGFELSDEESEFTVSPQGILAWYESGLLTAEENIVSDSLNICLLNVQIGNCTLPEVNVRIVQGQEFPYCMGLKAWNMLLSSLSSDD